MAKSPCLSPTPGRDLRKDPRGRQKPVKGKLPKNIRGSDHPRGATEPAAKLRGKCKAHATAHDTLKAEAAAQAKKLSEAKKDLAKYKADVEASGKATDDRLTKLQKERDDFKTATEQRAAEFEAFKLRSKLGDKLGIADAKRRDRALDAFLADYRLEGAGLAMSNGAFSQVASF